MNARRKWYLQQHRLYVNSAEFEAWKVRWREKAGNKAPIVLSLGQAWAATMAAGWPLEVSAVALAAMAGCWVAAYARPGRCPLYCRAHGMPWVRHPRVQDHHLAYRALDLNEGDMGDRYHRATVAGSERPIDHMALCRFDHWSAEKLLKIFRFVLRIPKTRLRRWVSWGWVVIARATVAIGPVALVRHLV